MLSFGVLNTYLNEKYPNCIWYKNTLKGSNELSNVLLMMAIAASIITLWRLLYNKVIRPFVIKVADRPNKYLIILPKQIRNDYNNSWKLEILSKLLSPHYNNLIKERTKMMKARNKSREAVKNVMELPPSNTIPKSLHIKMLADQFEYSVDTIKEYWLYYQRLQPRVQFINKTLEESWKGITTLIIWIIGTYIVFNENGIYNPYNLYILSNIPQKHNNSYLVHLYYYLGSGYHLHRTVWQIFDRKRSDLYMMIIHHYVTLCLIIISYYYGFMQSGIIVFWCHDISDAILAIGKSFIYINIKYISEILMPFLILSWIICRFYVLFAKIIYPIYYLSNLHGCIIIYWILLVCLVILLILHIIWLQLILNVAIKRITNKKSTKFDDYRSE